MMGGALALAFCSLWTSGPALADWPQPRHDAAHTGYTEDLVEPPLELKWTYDPPGREWGYVGFDTLLAAGDSLFIHFPNVPFTRINARTGEVVWRTAERE